MSIIRPGAKNEGLAQIRTGVAGIFDQSKSGVITTTLQTRLCQIWQLPSGEATTYTTIVLLGILVELFQYISCINYKHSSKSLFTPIRRTELDVSNSDMISVLPSMEQVYGRKYLVLGNILQYIEDI